MEKSIIGGHEKILLTLLQSNHRIYTTYELPNPALIHAIQPHTYILALQFMPNMYKGIEEHVLYGQYEIVQYILTNHENMINDNSKLISNAIISNSVPMVRLILGHIKNPFIDEDTVEILYRNNNPEIEQLLHDHNVPFASVRPIE